MDDFNASYILRPPSIIHMMNEPVLSPFLAVSSGLLFLSVIVNENCVHVVLFHETVVTSVQLMRSGIG